MKNNTIKSSIPKGTPWNSIKESISSSKSKNLSYKEALVSPCKSCSTSPCCTYLPLKTFEINTIIDLDHARYLLNFQHIELGLSSTGVWSAYYTYPCRFLDRETYNCSIHDKPQQPNICKKYSPYSCWYKKVCNTNKSDQHIRIDKTRMEFISNLIAFNDEGKIVKVPDYEKLNGQISAIMDEPTPHIEVNEDEHLFYKKWLEGEKDSNEENLIQGEKELFNPCNNCAAPCCKTLIFPQEYPNDLSKLDYLKFCLGFPGVELGISDQQWSIVIKTKCSNLSDDNKCKVFGKEERPLICKYYDEWKCSYKHEFGQIQPANFVRLKYNEYKTLMTHLKIGSNGQLLEAPTTGFIKEIIESSLV